MRLKALVLALALWAGPAWGAEVADIIDTCVGWQTDSNYVRIAFVHGWLRAVETADRLTSEVIMPSLWPAGHRAGSVKIEIDVLCQVAANRNTLIADLIVRIAREKNK